MSSPSFWLIINLPLPLDP